MQPVKAQNEDFSQSRLQAGEYHASTAGMMHVGIRNRRYFPVSLQIVTLKIHIFNVSMSILVFHSPDIIMDKKITSLGLSQHLGNDLTLKKTSSSCLLSTSTFTFTEDFLMHRKLCRKLFCPFSLQFLLQQDLNLGGRELIWLGVFPASNIFKQTNRPKQTKPNKIST